MVVAVLPLPVLDPGTVEYVEDRESLQLLDRGVGHQGSLVSAGADGATAEGPRGATSMRLTFLRLP